MIRYKILFSTQDGRITFCSLLSTLTYLGLLTWVSKWSNSGISLGLGLRIGDTLEAWYFYLGGTSDNLLLKSSNNVGLNKTSMTSSRNIFYARKRIQYWTNACLSTHLINTRAKRLCSWHIVLSFNGGNSHYFHTWVQPPRRRCQCNTSVYSTTRVSHP